MDPKKGKFGLFVFLLGLAVASCKVTQPYQSAPVRTDGLYRDVSATDTNSLATLRWHELFTDTLLQQLIREGIARNLDLKIAYTRIQQAEAYYRQSLAVFYPALNGNVGITESKLSEAQGFGIRNNATQYQLGLTTAWEADIWGRLRANRRASLASLLQSEAGARAIQTGLIASIANYYYRLLALDEQVAITQQTVFNWDTTVTTMRALKESAVVTEAAVVQSESQRYVAEVTIPDLRQSIRETENALSILLGAPPAGIPRGRLDDQRIDSTLQTGVPAQLLANRPDVQQAEQNYRYYFELTNVARAYFYPALSISGTAGFTSLSFVNLFNPISTAASIGAGLAQPIFNQRLNRTRLAVAQAQQQEAALNFQNTLLTAGQEVSDALSLHERALEKMRIRSNQMIALRKSVDYSQELLRNGFANYTEVITARQSLLQAELGSVNDRLQRLQSVVNLYRSLGGGWRP
ncbi:NodT family efflux transporter outer membrane factor (OMF) lipoprotein [Larkinella arboricola]|uniref:NodT family efflux transporter outer membrane factor (OMF) lipoprotein n=1 Tax=Larkinella arboricola TaxID=643671 RepID=A0A327WVX4_LARAB|nr:TolC family protein [Larkinella arboricola]RAJ97467.1 NodT family efflux transporter outer membrane factor (OMF) lipoprotein [Larkinella arboricola]